MGDVRGFNQNEIFTPNGEQTNCLFCITVIYGNITIIHESVKIGFLMDAIGQCFSNCAIVCNLSVFQLYPCKISVNFFGQNKLSLFQSINGWKIIKSVIDMEHFCNHGICFLSNRAIRSAFEGFYEIGKRTSCVYPAAADGQIIALSVKFPLILANRGLRRDSIGTIVSGNFLLLWQDMA